MYDIGKMLDSIDNQRLIDTLKFLAKMVAAGLVFRALLFVGFDSLFYQKLLAEWTAGVLGALNVEFFVRGTKIIGENGAYIVNQDCTGWKSMAVFSALVFASSDKFRKHLRFVLSGFIVIAVFNFARIVTTVYLSHQGIVSFEIIHTLVWRWGLTLLVLILWVYWLYKPHPWVEGTFKYQSSKL